MTTRRPLAWEVPASVWSAFRAETREEWGSLDDYLWYEVEVAMRQTLRCFEILDQLQTVSHQHGLSSSSVVGWRASGFDGATASVDCSIQDPLREEFRSAAEGLDLPNGDVLGVALSGAINDRLLALVMMASTPVLAAHRSEAPFGADESPPAIAILHNRAPRGLEALLHPDETPTWSEFQWESILEGLPQADENGSISGLTIEATAEAGTRLAESDTGDYTELFSSLISGASTPATGGEAGD